MKTQSFIMIILTILCIGLIIGTIVLSIDSQKLKETNTIFKTILTNEGKLNDLSTLDDENYNLASLSYEKSEWKEVVFYCEKARNYYSSNAQEIREMKEKLDTSKEVFKIYEEMLAQFVIIKNSMYEACEHFESASRYYEMYYEPTGTDSQYEMGTRQIETMNEKIRQHDRAVEDYNTLLVKYYLEIDKLV